MTKYAIKYNSKYIKVSRTLGTYLYEETDLFNDASFEDENKAVEMRKSFMEDIGIPEEQVIIESIDI